MIDRLRLLQIKYEHGELAKIPTCSHLHFDKQIALFDNLVNAFFYFFLAHFKLNSLSIQIGRGIKVPSNNAIEYERVTVYQDINQLSDYNETGEMYEKKGQYLQ